MEAADALYGVTMAPGGSSKVISQKVPRHGDDAELRQDELRQEEVRQDEVRQDEVRQDLAQGAETHASSSNAVVFAESAPSIPSVPSGPAVVPVARVQGDGVEVTRVKEGRVEVTRVRPDRVEAEPAGGPDQ
jgi:hypothetical protein